jgi:hypothetical protein
MIRVRAVLCVVAAVVPLVVPAGTGCTERRTTATERGTAGSPAQPSERHWVQDDKVREVMKRIAAGTASWPQDLPPHAEAANPLDLERAFADSARLAGTLAAAAGDLPAAVADRRMPDEHRRGFAEQAETLRRHALELREAARLHNVSEMQRGLARINTTCFECHDRYREVAGEIE